MKYLGAAIMAVPFFPVKPSKKLIVFYFDYF